MGHAHVTDAEYADLIRRVAESASAYIRGDMRTYLTLIKHADDYTLMTPFGGEPTRGFDTSSEYRESLERFFQAGEAELDLVQSYRSGDLPDQDWSLRVILVFRRDGAEWWLVHRHADPLVHGINLEQLAALARG